MFDSANATKNIPVTIRFTDGRSQSGNIIVAMSSDLPRTLNGEGLFVEFESNDGRMSFVGKGAIGQAIPTKIPKVKKLDAGRDSNSDFNPYRVLKIALTSDAETIRSAYHKLAKIYHPDRFTNVELPEEMAKYAENMCRLVNAAFQVLCDAADDNCAPRNAPQQSAPSQTQPAQSAPATGEQTAQAAVQPTSAAPMFGGA